MNTKNFILADMTADDFETARSVGYSYRRDLTHTVMTALTIPDKWEISGEYGSEYGGLFPVQVRLVPTHNMFELVLCSPGEVSDHWLLLMVSGKGRNVVCVRQSEYFDAATLNHAFFVADYHHRDGFTPSEITEILKRTVKS